MASSPDATAAPASSLRVQQGAAGSSRGNKRAHLMARRSLNRARWSSCLSCLLPARRGARTSGNSTSALPTSWTQALDAIRDAANLDDARSHVRECAPAWGRWWVMGSSGGGGEWQLLAECRDLAECQLGRPVPTCFQSSIKEFSSVCASEPERKPEARAR